MAGLDKDDFRHPKEKKWLTISLVLCSIIALFFFITVVLSIGDFEAAFQILVILALASIGFAIIYFLWRRSALLGDAVEVCDGQFPEIHSISAHVAQRLHMRQPRLFIKQDDSLNAEAIGLLGMNDVILHSGVIETMTPDELAVIIAHEFCHLKCSHSHFLFLTGEVEGLGVPVVGFWMRLIFLGWSRCAEFTCDRGALVACSNLDVVTKAFAKLSVGGKLAAQLNLDRLLLQRRDREDEVSRATDLLRSHPAIVDRIFALRDYASSKDYIDLCERLRAEETATGLNRKAVL